MTVEPGKIFVGGLSYSTHNESLHAFFSRWGDLKEAVVLREAGGRSRGFGFLVYATRRGADACLAAAAQDPFVLDGRRVDVKRAVPRDDAGPGTGSSSSSSGAGPSASGAVVKASLTSGSSGHTAAPGSHSNSNSSSSSSTTAGKVSKATAAPAPQPAASTTRAPSTTSMGKQSSAAPAKQGLGASAQAAAGTAAAAVAAKAPAPVAQAKTAAQAAAAPSPAPAAVEAKSKGKVEDKGPSQDKATDKGADKDKGKAASAAASAASKGPGHTPTAIPAHAAALGSPATVAARKVFVGGLHYGTDETALRTYFGKFGPLASAQVLYNRETRKSRGFGFVVFEDSPAGGPDAVERVLALGLFHRVDGKDVEIKRAVPKQGDAPAAAQAGGTGTGAKAVGSRPTAKAAPVAVPIASAPPVPSAWAGANAGSLAERLRSNKGPAGAAAGASKRADQATAGGPGDGPGAHSHPASVDGDEDEDEEEAAVLAAFGQSLPGRGLGQEDDASAEDDGEVYSALEEGIRAATTGGTDDDNAEEHGQEEEDEVGHEAVHLSPTSPVGTGRMPLSLANQHGLGPTHGGPVRATHGMRLRTVSGTSETWGSVGSTSVGPGEHVSGPEGRSMSIGSAGGHGARSRGATGESAGSLALGQAGQDVVAQAGATAMDGGNAAGAANAAQLARALSLGLQLGKQLGLGAGNAQAAVLASALQQAHAAQAAAQAQAQAAQANGANMQGLLQLLSGQGGLQMLQLLQAQAQAQAQHSHGQGQAGQGGGLAMMHSPAGFGSRQGHGMAGGLDPNLLAGLLAQGQAHGDPSALLGLPGQGVGQVQGRGTTAPYPKPERAHSYDSGLSGGISGDTASLLSGNSAGHTVAGLSVGGGAGRSPVGYSAAVTGTTARPGGRADGNSADLLPSAYGQVAQQQHGQAAGPKVTGAWGKPPAVAPTAGQQPQGQVPLGAPWASEGTSLPFSSLPPLPGDLSSLSGLGGLGLGQGGLGSLNLGLGLLPVPGTGITMSSGAGGAGGAAGQFGGFDGSSAGSMGLGGLPLGLASLGPLPGFPALGPSLQGSGQSGPSDLHYPGLGQGVGAAAMMRQGGYHGGQNPVHNR